MYREKSDSRQYSICTICRRTDHRRGSSEGFMQGVKSVTKQAFMKSIPIMCSYIFVSMAYGMMMENAGFAWYYSLLTSLTVYTGAFQFVLITFLSSGGIHRHDRSDSFVDEQQTEFLQPFIFGDIP